MLQWHNFISFSDDFAANTNFSLQLFFKSWLQFVGVNSHWWLHFFRFWFYSIYYCWFLWHYIAMYCFSFLVLSSNEFPIVNGDDFSFSAVKLFVTILVSWVLCIKTKIHSFRMVDKTTTSCDVFRSVFVLIPLNWFESETRFFSPF